MSHALGGLAGGRCSSERRADVMAAVLKVLLCVKNPILLVHAYLKDNPVEFHPDLIIETTGPLAFSKRVTPTSRSKKKKKMSSHMRSVPGSTKI